MRLSMGSLCSGLQSSLSILQTNAAAAAAAAAVAVKTVFMLVNVRWRAWRRWKTWRRWKNHPSVARYGTEIPLHQTNHSGSAAPDIPHTDGPC